MSKKTRADEVSFNYPIPKSLHHNVKVFAAKKSMSVKDVVISSLVYYLSHMDSEPEETEEL